MKPQYWNKGKIYLSNKDRVLKNIINKFPNENIIVVCADIEDQIMNLQAEDRKDFMVESGIKNTVLKNLIKENEKFFTINFSSSAVTNNYY